MIHVNQGWEFPAAGWHIHEGYNRAHFMDLDVGVVAINGNFFVTRVAVPIPLNNFDPPAGAQVTISGWGLLSNNGAIPDILQWADVNVVDRAACLAAYGLNIGIKYEKRGVKEVSN